MGGQPIVIDSVATENNPFWIIRTHILSVNGLHKLLLNKYYIN